MQNVIEMIGAGIILIGYLLNLILFFVARKKKRKTMDKYSQTEHAVLLCIPFFGWFCYGLLVNGK